MLQDSKDSLRAIVKLIDDAISEIDDNEPSSEVKASIITELDYLKDSAENILRMM